MSSFFFEMHFLIYLCSFVFGGLIVLKFHFILIYIVSFIKKRKNNYAQCPINSANKLNKAIRILKKLISC